MQQIFLCFAVALSIPSCQANGELAPVDNGKDVAFALAADLLPIRYSHRQLLVSHVPSCPFNVFSSDRTARCAKAIRLRYIGDVNHMGGESGPLAQQMKSAYLCR